MTLLMTHLGLCDGFKDVLYMGISVWVEGCPLEAHLEHQHAHGPQVHAVVHPRAEDMLGGEVVGSAACHTPEHNIAEQGRAGKVREEGKGGGC